MKRSIFYRCMISKESFFALRTFGYTEGGIGLVRTPVGWVATHVPTGTNITPSSSMYSTARQALVEAEQLIAEREDILEIIQNIRGRKGYDTFLNDRSKQLLVDERNNEDLPF